MRLVSQKLRDSARGRPCALRLPGICNFDESTTVLAHLAVNHRGMAIKSPDAFAVFACSSCHDAIDRRVPASISSSDLLRALAETQMHWIETGLLVFVGEQGAKSYKPLPKILPRNTSL